MSTAEDLRKLALALPESFEDTHRGRPAFRVNKRIFAMLGVAGNRRLFPALDCDGVAVVKLDRDDQLNMAARYEAAVTPTESYGHHGWTCVRLGQLDLDSLATVIKLAWANVAPKRLSRSG